MGSYLGLGGLGLGLGSVGLKLESVGLWFGFECIERGVG